MTSRVKDARFRLTRALASPPRRPGSDPGLSWLHPLGSYMGKGHETGCVAQRPSSLCSLIGQSFMNVTLSRGPGVGRRAWKGKRPERDTGTCEFLGTPGRTAAPSGQDALHPEGQPRPVGGRPARRPEAEGSRRKGPRARSLPCTWAKGAGRSHARWTGQQSETQATSSTPWTLLDM